jgi:hypothetical protein
MVSLHGDERFPLASVCNLPIAMHMLALVDDGKFTRRQMIEVPPRDVVRNVSPIAARWPAERHFPLDESDNTAVETFLRMEGASLDAPLAWLAHRRCADRAAREPMQSRSPNRPEAIPERSARHRHPQRDLAAATGDRANPAAAYDALLR